MRCDAFRRDFIVAAARAAFLGSCAPAALAAPAPSGAAPVVLVVGDSLSAEYGIARGTGWVALLEKKLAAEKIPATVVNASVSGDTTAGGRSRLPGLLAQHKPAVVVIELGATTRCAACRCRAPRRTSRPWRRPPARPAPRC